MKFGSDTHFSVRRLEERVAFRLRLQGNCSAKPKIRLISHENGIDVTYQLSTVPVFFREPTHLFLGQFWPHVLEKEEYSRHVSRGFPICETWCYESLTILKNDMREGTNNNFPVICGYRFSSH
jgi:hypothetical protein